MHDKTAHQLQQDAQKLQQLAESRLDAMQFNQQLEQALNEQKPPANQHGRLQNRTPWLAIAAVVTLTAMVWLFLQQPINTPEVEVTTGRVVAVEKPPQLDWMQWPRAVESQVNQPLLDEQQAIIADLKALKTRLLSI